MGFAGATWTPSVTLGPKLFRVLTAAIESREDHAPGPRGRQGEEKEAEGKQTFRNVAELIVIQPELW